MQTLEGLLIKYPLTFAYLLEKKLKAPDFLFFKKNPVLSFIDYILLINPYAMDELSGFISLLINTCYCFTEEGSSNRHIPSGDYYIA